MFAVQNDVEAEEQQQNEEETNVTDKATKNNPELFESIHSAFKVAVEVGIYIYLYKYP
jgi:hypothetical protein